MDNVGVPGQTRGTKEASSPSPHSEAATVYYLFTYFMFLGHFQALAQQQRSRDTGYGKREIGKEDMRQRALGRIRTQDGSKRPEP